MNTIVSDSDVTQSIESLLPRVKESKTKEFLEALLGSAQRWGKLTERQQEAFDRVEYNHSDEGIAEQEAWREVYLEGLREDTLIAAEYYDYMAYHSHGPRYFADAAKSILDNPDYIPSRKLYEKMVLNKYAQKIIEQTKADPLYSEGDCVMMRGRPQSDGSGVMRIFTVNNKRVWKNYPAGHVFVVVDNNLPCVKAVKGGRRYLVLPFGDSDILEVEERHIKKARI